jgi:hypothetical protein
LTLNGSAGAVSHSANASLVVNSAQKLPHSPFRTSYLRTDTQWDVSFLAFAPQRLILYHAPTRRFFSSSTFLNRVDVIDARPFRHLHRHTGWRCLQDRSCGHESHAAISRSPDRTERVCGVSGPSHG